MPEPTTPTTPEKVEPKLSPEKSLTEAITKAEAPAPPTVAKEGDAKPTEPTTPAPAKPAEVTPTPTPEIVSKVEHDRIIQTIKGGNEGTVRKLTNDLTALKGQYTTLLDRFEEVEFAKKYQGAIEAGMPEKDASKIIYEMKEQAKVTRANADKTAELADREVLLNEAAKNKSAADFITEYHLDPAVRTDLLTSENIQAMEIKALKLAQAPAKVELKPAETLNKAQAATASRGEDFHKIDPARRLGVVMEETEQAK